MDGFFVRTRVVAGFLIGLIISAVSGSLSGQTVAPPPSARDFDLKVEDGQVPKAGNFRKLLARNEAGAQQVVRLLSRVDDQLVVIRPTGSLSLVDRSDVQPTDDAFGKVSKSDVLAELNQSGLHDFKIATAKPYVFAYACDEAFYMHTRSILQSMYPGVIQQLKDWGLKPTAPELPLLVVIMPDRESFDKLRKLPPEVAAYYNSVSNRIVLYKDLKLAGAAPDLALKQAAYTVAHEGVHQLLANTNIQQRLSDWPKWLSEGLPEYLCPLTVNSRIVKHGSSDLPERTLTWTKAGKVNDLRMHTLLRRRGAGGRVIRTAVVADQLTSDGYAIAWGLTHYLATKQQDKFQSYLAEVSRIEPLNMYTDESDAHEKTFVKYFGENYPRLERKVQEHLNSKEMQRAYSDPVANQTFYFMKRIVKQGRRVVSVSAALTVSPDAAKKWKEAQEEQFDDVRVTTKVCKSKREAEFQIHKFRKAMQ